MEEALLFDEDAILVSPDFVRKASMSWAIGEIKKLTIVDYRTDGHVAPVLWVFAFIAFILWISAPSQNAFILIFLVPLVIAALYKQTNPNPIRYRVYVSTGGLLGIGVLDTTDQDQAERLKAAIEHAIAAVHERPISSHHASAELGEST